MSPALPRSLLAILSCAVLAQTSASPLDWLPDSFPVPENGICARDYLSQEMGAATLRAAQAEFDSLEEWQSYRELVRQQILAGAGLDPLPPKTPLDPILSEPRNYDGYSVRNLAFQSLPDVWVTGSLYLPQNLDSPRPALLSPHGHARLPETGEDWLRHGRFHEQTQVRAATLARMGVIVLTLDMFGYGDGIELYGYAAHKSDLSMRLQLWNAIRALDFLETLPETDPSRLAVSGASGGATQSFLLAAVDERIAASIPVVMVSAHFFGGCPCESGRPIHWSERHFASNPMIAALAAPRPQLLISVGGDWTLNTPQVEYPYLRSVYELYGQEQQIANAHFPSENHDFGPSKRNVLYKFLAQQFDLDAAAIDESAITIERYEQLRVFSKDHPIPSNALRDVAAIEQAFDQSSGRSVLARD